MMDLNAHMTESQVWKLIGKSPDTFRIFETETSHFDEGRVENIAIGRIEDDEISPTPVHGARVADSSEAHLFRELAEPLRRHVVQRVIITLERLCKCPGNAAQ